MEVLMKPNQEYRKVRNGQKLWDMIINAPADEEFADILDKVVEEHRRNFRIG